MSNSEVVYQAADDCQRLVCGYPKTGRTWLRYMIAHTLADTYGLDNNIDLNNVYSFVPNENVGVISGQPTFAYEGVVPKIEMSHRHYQPEFSNARKVFMTRDPRDVIVSHWLHDTLQVKLFCGSLSEYVRSPRHGIAAFIGHLESWAPYLENGQLITYEEMRGAPVAVLSRVMEHLDVSVSDKSIKLAATLGEIDNMRQVEASSGIAGHKYDRANPEARRVREGRVGGFVRYLSTSDAAYIDSHITEASIQAQKIIAQTPYPFD